VIVAIASSLAASAGKNAKRIARAKGQIQVSHLRRSVSMKCTTRRSRWKVSGAPFIRSSSVPDRTELGRWEQRSWLSVKRLVTRLVIPMPHSFVDAAVVGYDERSIAVKNETRLCVGATLYRTVLSSWRSQSLELAIGNPQKSGHRVLNVARQSPAETG
jgi:hypothetical protein